MDEPNEQYRKGHHFQSWGKIERVRKNVKQAKKDQQYFSSGVHSGRENGKRISRPEKISRLDFPKSGFREIISQNREFGKSGNHFSKSGNRDFGKSFPEIGKSELREIISRNREIGITWNHFPKSKNIFEIKLSFS